MTLEEQIAALNKKIDDYHADDAKKSQGDRYENLSCILYAFALATASLALAAASPPITGEKLAAIIVSGIAVIVFLIVGVIATVKLKKYRRWFEF